MSVYERDPAALPVRLESYRRLGNTRRSVSTSPNTIAPNTFHHEPRYADFFDAPQEPRQPARSPNLGRAPSQPPDRAPTTLS